VALSFENIESRRLSYLY